MASAPSALQRRGHSFEGVGGKIGSSSSSGGQGGGGLVVGEKKSSSEANWRKKGEAFDEEDDDDDQQPLRIARSVVKKTEAVLPSPAAATAGTASTSSASASRAAAVAGSGGGSRGEASARREASGTGGLEKKRGLGGGLERTAVTGNGGGETGSPVSKKVKVGAGIMESSRKREQDLDDEDEDDVPLAARMKSKNASASGNAPSESIATKLAAAKAAKKARMEGLAGLANPLAVNGTEGPAPAKVASATTARPSSVEGQDRKPLSPGGRAGSRDEKPVERKIAGKPVAKSTAENSVPDSDESDDDKPLSHRKSMAVPTAKESKPDNKELREVLAKKRPASGGSSTPTSNQGSIKKLKVVTGGQQSQKPSLQSPKSGSLQSPRLSAVKRETDSPRSSTRKPAAGRPKDEDDDDDDDNLPLSQRISSISGSAAGKSAALKKPSAASGAGRDASDDDEDDHLPLNKRPAAPTTPKVAKKITAIVKKPSAAPAKSITKKVLEQRRKGKGTVKVNKQVVKAKVASKSSKSSSMIVSGGTKKWDTLEHSGVIFPPAYQPHGVKMLYKGKPVTLTPDQEEVATMFAVMKDTDYATKPKFLENFWADWKPILGKGHVIQDFKGCDFGPIYDWHMAEKEKKKSLTSEEKKRIREEKAKSEEKYMWALVNGVKEKVGNFRVEPPGLFRGRGEHPKMGKLKKRIFPENIVINIGKGTPIPECPMPGHKWKEIRHDNTVTWLAFWNDPINNKEFKYVFLAPSSTLKGQSDMEKYEKARLLKDHIENIRKTYTKNFTSSDSATRQIAVATYLIDRLALRAGNEKDEDEADTVGCCSLKFEHVILVPPRSVTFDFLGKDSIRYFNTVEVDEKVYKAIGDFKKGKRPGNDLFDKLDTSKLNAHLKGIMPALTAKVFRTYNASITLDDLLQTTIGNTAPEKVADYQRANKEVAILCNHQRTVSKSHSSQMEKLEAKMSEATDLIMELKVDLDRAKKGKPPLKDADGKPKKAQSRESLEKKITAAELRVEKMKLDIRIKDDLKTVALGTSKINYMDPRISVAWCKRHEVPIEKVFNKSLLAKFAWAMDVEPEYRF